MHKTTGIAGIRRKAHKTSRGTDPFHTVTPITSMRGAIFTFITIALLIIGGWGAGHILGGHTNSMDPVTFFVEASTMGTILVLLVYLASNIALPFYYKKFRPAEFSLIKHVVLPALGGSGDRGTALLPGEARTTRPLQLVPLRRTGHLGRLDHLCRIPHPAGPKAG